MAARTIVKIHQTVIQFAIVLAIILETAGRKECPTVRGDRTYVTSPNFPDEYPHNYECFWKFETIPGRRIELVFDTVEMEVNENCKYDYVSLYDNVIDNNHLLEKFCGNMKPTPVISRTHRIFLVFHSDSSNSYKGFRVFAEYFYFKEEDREYLNWYFLNTRRQHIHTTNNWGTGITRTAVALFLNDPRFFAVGNRTGEEIAYEITLQLMSKLVKKEWIVTKDLALFVNAMIVACIDPKNFFSVNIVSELRNRVDSSNYTNPFFILTLCNAGGHIKTEDILKLQQLFDAHLRPSWTNSQAMVILALQCISEQQPHRNLNTILAEMLLKLKRKQKIDGTVDNLKTTALVIQALIATGSTVTNFNLSMAINSVAKGMKRTHADNEEMYYIMTVLLWKSLLDINSNHCTNTVKTDFQKMNDSRKIPDDRIQVHISIVIGDNMEFTRTLSIKVPSNFSLYQVLENISSLEPGYLIEFTDLGGKPYVTGVTNFKESVEDDLFWFIYSKPLSSSDHPILLKDSPVDIQVNEADEFILWYRSGSETTTQKASTDITDASKDMNTFDIKDMTTIDIDDMTTIDIDDMIF